MMGNRPEFHLCDLAGVTLGAAPFSIYQTSSAGADRATSSATRPRAWRSSSRRTCRRCWRRADELPALEHVIVVDGEAPEGTIGAGRRWRRRAQARTSTSTRRSRPSQPDDVATLIYTSGTTGPPKGVELTHANVFGAVRAVQEMIDLPPGAKVISWLPAAHIAERDAHHYMPVVYACTVTTLPGPAPNRRGAAAGPPDLVLRRPAHLGEAEGRPGDDARRAARGGARESRGRAGRLAAGGAAAPARRAGAATSWRRPSSRPTGRCSPACARCSGSTRS